MHQINQKRMPAQNTRHPDRTGSGKIRQMEVPSVAPVKNFPSEGSKENHSKPCTRALNLQVQLEF